jgi:CDP-diacylglycerol--glycerol-3-phosphate 3-phosphatidyltransferase
MDKLLNGIATHVRTWMLLPARSIDFIFRGRVSPNHITLISLLGHLAVLWALAERRPLLGALLLAFFGIMDSLDGALAKVQKKTSVRGMFYDAVSDRAKEVLVYCGIAIYLDWTMQFGESNRFYGWWGSYGYLWVPVAVLGLSQLVSYIKAKGEMALSSSGYDSQKLNRVFTDGLARYEVRMSILIVGLLTGHIYIALHVLLVLLLITCLQRLINIRRALGDV